MNTMANYAAMQQFSLNCFLKMGCSPEDANTAVQSLLSADLAGIDSHGIARLSGYVRLWESGRINATPKIRCIYETPSTGVVDGDGGLGLVVAPMAMKLAMEKAKNVGSGWISVQNSNHFGIAGQYSNMAAESDMIGISMTNASALVAPTHGKERMLGTNPIAVAIPAGEEPIFLADFATTTAANGKLELLQRAGKDIPGKWVQDKNGEVTYDAEALKKGGAMLPLGSDSEHGSHKGYMLGSIVDIFSGVLSGANFGPWVPPFPAYIPLPENQPGKGIGHFFGAMRIDAFRPASDFKNDMDLWIKRFRCTEPINNSQPVVIPGDPERKSQKERLANGIPIHQAVLEDLDQLASKLNISKLFS